MKEIRIPDIGSATAVDLIAIMVATGARVAQDDPLITLESDKASMEIPAPCAGTVASIHLRVGDKVSTGDLILMLHEDEQTQLVAQPPEVAATNTGATSEELSVLIPDIGTAAQVDVIAVEVAVGDEVQAEQTLITLEGEKATMDIPAPSAGTIKQISVKVGDKVSQGVQIMVLQTTVMAKAAPVSHAASAATVATPRAASARGQATPAASDINTHAAPVTRGVFYAGPAVRRFARELGVDLTKVVGSGTKGRILKLDVQAYVKTQLAKLQSGSGMGLGLTIAELPKVDFAKFGAIEIKPLTKIKRLTATNLHRNWLLVPHVTQFDEADITEMEAFRQQHKSQAEAKGVKLTPLVFIMRAVVAALQEYPQFNASLSDDGQQLIVKKYFHLGVAVDTANGLVVPVIRDVNTKSLLQLAQELAAISDKARSKGLAPAEMQGGCFTISSLGGVGGTAFTPIINMPEVAILGVSKAKQQPVYQEGKFVPRLMEQRQHGLLLF
jgi:pyruvate dehydrogenase E2 component (dihydrolipoamide acetyltransferase)